MILAHRSVKYTSGCFPSNPNPNTSTLFSCRVTLVISINDQDADPDLVIANHETPYITVLFNDGQATFQEAPYSPLNTGALPHVHGLTTGDFNGDSWPDIAVDSADTRQVRVLHGSKDGFSQAVPVGVPTMPYFRLGTRYTADALPQILVPGHSDNTVHLIQYESDSYYVHQLVDLGGQPWGVAADDINGDGNDDLIIIQTDAVSAWLATAGGFSQARGSPYPIRGATGVTTGDTNHDQIADILVGPWESDEIVLISGGDFSVRSLKACERPVGLAVADLFGDARLELVAACPTQDQIVVLSVQ